ncbi:MAG: HAMP domain-containing protein [Deltaproteobacteria bacterium]|nr:MAG: HAMP domain-containing protein [Deltaproteobacteria bacterium]
MRLRREAGLGVGSILALQIALSVLAITLLQRMGPAIERIIEENVETTEAVEAMLAALASDGADAEASERFAKALERARARMTRPELERPLIERVEADRAAAFAGDPEARARIVSAVLSLGEMNRGAMVEADRRAKRLGQVGAWSAVLLGALALALGILVYRRLRLHLELPIEGIRRTVQQVREGNLQARCAAGEGPSEIRQIARDLNWILDQVLQARDRPADKAEALRETELRRVIGRLLDRDGVPQILLDSQGHVVAASRAALSGEAPPPPTDEAPGPWDVEPIEGTHLRLARWVAAGAQAGPAQGTPASSEPS